jgi:excisionase family DNA binding protein
MTTAEAAHRLGITPRSVARLIRGKQLAAIWNEYARRFEIDEAEVERYKMERRGPGRPSSSSAA